MAKAGVSNLGNVLRDFNRTIPNMLKEQINDIKKEVAKDILANLVEETPEDTSHLVANWQVGINSAPTGEIEGSDPGGSSALSRGEAVIDSSQYKDNLVITNNVDYLPYVIAGSSTGTPNDFVNRAVDRAARKRR